MNHGKVGKLGGEAVQNRAGLIAAASFGTAHAETKLKMMYTAVSGFTASYVAQEQGFFKKRGIDMEFIQTMSSGNNPPALVSNSVQVAGPTMPTLLQANDSGLDLVVIANGAVYAGIAVSMLCRVTLAWVQERVARPGTTRLSAP